MSKVAYTKVLIDNDEYERLRQSEDRSHRLAKELASSEQKCSCQKGEGADPVETPNIRGTELQYTVERANNYSNDSSSHLLPNVTAPAFGENVGHARKASPPRVVKDEEKEQKDEKKDGEDGAGTVADTSDTHDVPFYFIGNKLE